MMDKILCFFPLVGSVGILVALFIYSFIKRKNEGTEKMKAIASQIEVKIESTISSTQQSIEENDREYYSSVFVSKTKIIVDEMKLRGIQIVREAAEGDKYYALAVLDKDIYTNSLKAELDYYYDKLSVLVNDSKAFLERGNIKTALENLVDAMSIVEEFYPRMVLYNTISIESYKVSGDISINKVLSHIRAILTGIRLKIVSGNDQSNPAGQLLPEPLVVKVICDMRGTEIPLPDMPVIAKYANKEKLGNYTSDEHGLVTIFAESVPTDGDRGRISVYLNLYGLPPILKENLRKTEVEFRYTISEPKMSLTFAVDIKDERGRALKKVEGKIERAIKKMGYNIAEKDNAMLILEGVVRKGEVKEVGFFRPNLVKTEELKAGDIGYLVSGLKEKGWVRIGDTLVAKKTASQVQALPGYREPQPVVFNDLYPQADKNFEDLKLGLEKLRLNDPALVFKPVVREGLGKGFQVGFLGLLHTEVVVRRLEEDFSLNLVVTAPTVSYRLETDRGQLIINSPIDWPSKVPIKKIEEPWVRMEIIVRNARGFGNSGITT